MRTLCPAAAAAWRRAISFGRARKPSFVVPSAMAPLETRTICRPSPLACSIAFASLPNVA